MRANLEQLNMTPGIIGSVVVAFDGLVIEKDVAEGVNAPVMAAEAVQVAASFAHVGNLSGIGEIDACMLQTERGVVFAVPLTGVGWLLAFGDAEANVGPVRQAMQSAAREITGGLPRTGDDEDE
jgi:predicted regulator of Ras-like GTPase activity (Roadblock/LC7/MglB family)